MIVKTEEDAPLMLVLPATHRVDFARLQTVLGTRAELEEERAFRALFPDCKTGAAPLFGNLFGLNTLVDNTLTHDEQIVFNAGSHWQPVLSKRRVGRVSIKPDAGLCQRVHSYRISIRRLCGFLGGGTGIEISSTPL